MAMIRGRDPYSPAFVIECLAPLVTARRLARMETVLAGRSSHAAFVFERMTDPHNLSAALRSLDAFGFQDVHIVAPGERLGLASAVSIGSERWLSLHRSASDADCVAGLRARGYRVLASHVSRADPAESLAGIDFHAPVALVFGNEHAGVGEAMLRLADGRFHIDMLGFVESLNLSVSVAVSAFHARQALRRLMREDAGAADRYALPAARRAELLAEWLRRSVKRADAILAEAVRSG